MKRYNNNEVIMGAIIALMLFVVGIPAKAQQQQQKVSDVRVVVKEVRQERDSIRAVLDIEITGIAINHRGEIYLFPMIRSGMYQCKMPPVVVSGRKRYAVVKREERLSRKKEPFYARYNTKGDKPFYRKIAYTAAVSVENWMADANVAMVEERANCRGEFNRLSMEIIANRITLIEQPVRSVYELPVKLPVPPREEIKNRSESGEAQIVYTVGNAVIKPTLGNNEYELNKIRRSIEDIRNVQGVTINSVSISSYASPEGTWQSNLTLSERRAASLAEWIRRNYDLRNATLNSRGLGEDWDGLTQLIKDDPVMTSAEKETVLGIIETVGIFDGLEGRIQQYNGGNTYRYMLKNLFPPLRRSAYRIDFTVPEYSIETVKEIFKTYPNMLSLYEFYLLANEYEPGSSDFRQVIMKAAEMYPEEKLNKITMSMYSYFDGNIPAGLEFLQGLEDDPEAWLYFSVLYAKEGSLDKAEAYARKALAAGNPDAAHHLELIRKYREDDDQHQDRMLEWETYGIEK